MVTSGGALIVVPAKDGASRWYWEASWRHAGRRHKRRLGEAWIRPRATPIDVKGWGTKCGERPGNPSGDQLTPQQATVAMRDLIVAFATAAPVGVGEHQQGGPGAGSSSAVLAAADGCWRGERSKGTSAATQAKPTTADMGRRLSVLEECASRRRLRVLRARRRRALLASRPVATGLDTRNQASLLVFSPVVRSGRRRPRRSSSRARGGREVVRLSPGGVRARSRRLRRLPSPFEGEDLGGVSGGGRSSRRR